MISIFNFRKKEYPCRDYALGVGKQNIRCLDEKFHVDFSFGILHYSFMGYLDLSEIAYIGVDYFECYDSGYKSLHLHFLGLRAEFWTDGSYN